MLELKAARPAFTVGFKVPANPGGVPAARAADEVASTGPAELRSKSEDEWKAVFVANAEEDGMIQEDDIAPAARQDARVPPAGVRRPKTTTSL